ncbi:MAG: ribulose-phosphate 3-epimerase [Bacteriovoracaceae bacterium]
MIIAPSILSANFLKLEEEIKAFDKARDLWFHLDVMDGHFVPNLTFGATVLKEIKTITKHKLDAHFMVTNPLDYVEWFKDVGLHNFTFHWEAENHHDRVIQKIKENYPSVGVSLNPATNVDLIPDYILEEIDVVLLMSVNPGFGGQSFIPSVLDKIQTLHKRKKELKADFHIQVDGGVTNLNTKALIKAGATNLVAGSYIFGAKANEYLTKVESLRP